MTAKIFVIADLGPGDGGKGGVVHTLATRHKAHTVIKVGGAQGSHGVTTKRHKFAFSQWGCGTFEGVPTHITHRMIVSPEGLLNEADGLRYCGVGEAFDLLTIDERAICATGYHGVVSRVKEIARGKNPRGTIGTGVGESYRDYLVHPELTIRAGDLKCNLRKVLSNIRDLQIVKLKDIGEIGEIEDKEDAEIVKNEMHLLEDDGFLDHQVEKFKEAGSLAQIVDSDYFSRSVLSKDGVAVVESSHGILTDNKFGFRPHVSAIRTLPIYNHQMLEEAGFTGEIKTVGVHRAYSIRHGAGPLPTADEQMNEILLPGSHKEENRYQGKIRVGPLDLVLLKYAIDVCAGMIDFLALTWYDQVERNWHICERYENPDPRFFTPNGSIHGMSDTTDLCDSLFKCKPKITSVAIPDSREEQYRLCNRILFEKLGVPVGLVSFGPAEWDTLYEV